MQKFERLIYLFIAIYVIRFAASISMGLMPQDAYYFFYSQNLALSYFDHPPMVAYMLKFFNLFLGKSVWAIKFTNFATTLLSVYAFYHLAGYFLSQQKSQIAAMLYASTLLISVLSINSTPDVPLMLFWTLALISLYRAIFLEKVLNWVGAGFFMGLAFDSKYTALIMLPGLFMFLILSAKHRKLLLSYKPYLAVLIFVITIYPIYYWNVQNDWISFSFQSSRSSSISKFVLQPKYFMGNLGTQIGLLLPVLFALIFWFYYRISKKTIVKRLLPDQNKLFLISFSLPIIGFFFAVSMFYWVKLNWIMPGYIAAIILAAPYISRKYLKIQLISSVVLNLVLFVQIYFYPIDVKSDDTWFGWEQLSEKVMQIEEQNPGHFVFANDNYKTSAVLNFYLDHRVYSSNVIGELGLQFNIIDKDLSHLYGKDAIFLDSDTRMKNFEKKNAPRPELEKYFEHVVELDPILIEDSSDKVRRKFFVYRCSNYKSSN